MSPAKISFPRGWRLSPALVAAAMFGCSTAPQRAPGPRPPAYAGVELDEQGGFRPLVDAPVERLLEWATELRRGGNLMQARAAYLDVVRSTTDTMVKLLALRGAAECVEQTAEGAKGQPSQLDLELRAYRDYAELRRVAREAENAEMIRLAVKAMDRLFTTLVLDDQKVGRGAAVWLDDRLLAPDELTMGAPVKPGRHLLRLVVAGAVIGCDQADVAGGEGMKRVDLHGPIDCPSSLPRSRCSEKDPNPEAHTFFANKWQQAKLDWDAGLLSRSCRSVEELAPEFQCSADVALARGRCQEWLAVSGKRGFAAAHQSYSRAVRHGIDTADHQVRNAAKRLETRLAWIKIALGRANDAGLEVRVDDERLSAEELEYPVAVAPGAHSVRVTAPNGATWNARVELLRVGDVKLVRPEASVPRGRSVGLTVSGALLLAGSAAAVVWGSTAACSGRDAEGLCYDGDRVNQRRLAGWIGGGAGGVLGLALGVAGVVGLARAPSWDKPVFTLGVGPGSVLVQGSF